MQRMLCTSLGVAAVLEQEDAADLPAKPDRRTADKAEIINVCRLRQNVRTVEITNTLIWANAQLRGNCVMSAQNTICKSVKLVHEVVKCENYSDK